MMLIAKILLYGLTFFQAVFVSSCCQLQFFVLFDCRGVLLKSLLPNAMASYRDEWYVKMWCWKLPCHFPFNKSQFSFYIQSFLVNAFIASFFELLCLVMHLSFSRIGCRLAINSYSNHQGFELIAGV